jgi:hypothetical protein
VVEGCSLSMKSQSVLRLDRLITYNPQVEDAAPGLDKSGPHADPVTDLVRHTDYGERCI